MLHERNFTLSLCERVVLPCNSLILSVQHQNLQCWSLHRTGNMYYFLEPALLYSEVVPGKFQTKPLIVNV